MRNVETITVVKNKIVELLQQGLPLTKKQLLQQVNDCTLYVFNTSLLELRNEKAIDFYTEKFTEHFYLVNSHAKI